jgi:hypothetical protein
LPAFCHSLTSEQASYLIESDRLPAAVRGTHRLSAQRSTCNKQYGIASEV